MPELAGVLPVDKPVGPTSHDVIAAARRALRQRRIGHTGTLDPFASGLLLLCIGTATRLAEYLTPLPKTYRATLRLGQVTDTDDHTGRVTAETEAWEQLGEGDIRSALEQQCGTIQQLPPLYSAKKVEGERMYAAARRGESPERRAVPVTVHRIELLELQLPEVQFEVECSSGTYIRAIARDVGQALGVGGHLSGLRRIASGGIRVEDAVSLEALSDPQQVKTRLIAPADAVPHLPRVTVDAELAALLVHGRAIPATPDAPGAGVVAICSAAGVLLAIGETRVGVIQPRKVFADAPA